MAGSKKASKKKRPKAKKPKTQDAFQEPASAESQGPPADPQLSSRLMQLPGQLRNLIYVHLFSSTRITSGERRTGRISRIKIKSAPNSLAILRTCRKIYQEAASLWVGLVTFNFEAVEALLDKLSPLAADTLSRIRYIRTRGDTLMLQPVGDDDDVYYRLAQSLKLLPSLHLEVLTVLGPGDGLIAYDTLNGLIEGGNGWRELHFITPNSSMLGFAEEHGYLRKPQPSAWQATLIGRDSAKSKPTVTIYRCSQPDAPGSILKSQNRQFFEQLKPSKKDIARFGMQEDRPLMVEMKELMVIVTRGEGVDITERSGPPFGPEDIREWAYGMSWAAIRRECIDNWPEDDPFADLHSSDDDEDFQIDNYESVDEVVWDNIK